MFKDRLDTPKPKRRSRDAARTLIYPVFLPNAACPGTCIYCDQSKISGQMQNPDLDELLKELEIFISHNAGKTKQIAFYGGTFTGLERSFRDTLMGELLPLMDDETSLRISTHPLFVGDDELAWCKQNRISTIELGIQDFTDEVLAASKRGYTSAEAVAACYRVRDAGFELGIQLMPGLPSWTDETLARNHQLLKEILPDALRVYPLVLIQGTPLAESFKLGEYQPLSLDEAIGQCVGYLQLCEETGIRLIKLGIPSNIEPADIVAGPYHPSFGEFVKAEHLVSKIVLDFKAESPIILDRKQFSLLYGHQKKYLRLLEDRLGTSSLKILFS